MSLSKHFCQPPCPCPNTHVEATHNNPRTKQRQGAPLWIPNSLCNSSIKHSQEIRRQTDAPVYPWATHWEINRQNKRWVKARAVSFSCKILSHTVFLFLIYICRSAMDFILPPTSPDGGIPWEKYLPPLIPRLNGAYGQYNWNPKLLIPESENISSAEVGDVLFCWSVQIMYINGNLTVGTIYVNTCDFLKMYTLSSCCFMTLKTKYIFHYISFQLCVFYI